MRRPLCPSMKQISDGETTTSSRPAFRGLTAASVMALRFSFAGGWKRLLLSYAPGDFKEAAPYTRCRASPGDRLLRSSPDQRDAGAGVRAHAPGPRLRTA